MAWELVTILIVIVIIVLLFFLLKNFVLLIINSIIGLFALFGFNLLFGTNVAINFWSILITAIGGIIGFAAVLLLHFTGIAF